MLGACFAQAWIQFLRHGGHSANLLRIGAHFSGLMAALRPLPRPSPPLCLNHLNTFIRFVKHISAVIQLYVFLG